MLLEVAVFLGLIAIACFFFATFTKNNAVLGIFGGVVLLAFSIFVLTSGIQVKSGESTTSTSGHIINGTYVYTTDNSTNSTNGNVNYFDAVSSSDTTVYTYTTLSFPFMVFNNDFGLVLLLISLWAIIMFSYRTAGQG